MTELLDSTPALRRSRTRALLRALMITAIVVPVVAGVSLWVVTRSWFIALMAGPGLQQRLGGDIKIGHAEYRGEGKLIFENFELIARGHEGPGARVLRIGRAEIQVDADSLLGDQMRIETVELDNVVVRLSEDRRNPGVFNFGSLTPDWSADPGNPPMAPPSVTIKRAVIQVGEHVGKEYRTIGERHVTGEMYPSAGKGWYTLRLQELDPNNVSLGPDGLQVQGEWNVETLEHRVTVQGLTLDDRTYGMCPQVARLWWQRMRPQGPVGRAHLEWRKGEQFRALLEVGGMALTIPIGAGEFATPGADGEAARLPRMFVEQGTIRLEGNELALENLRGSFGSHSRRGDAPYMPYTVNLSIRDLPAFDWRTPQAWMDSVVGTAPFSMTVDMDNFQLERSETEAPVELPRQVSATLDKFSLSGWTLDTKVDITRDPPVPGPDGELIASKVRTVGRAQIRDAFGAFDGFPYPLDGVTAGVRFEGDEIKIEYLQGTGADDANVRIQGSIHDPGPDATVRLTLAAKDVPLDDRFKKALRGGQLKIYEVMLHEKSYGMLREAGLLPDEEAVAGAEARRPKLRAELARLVEQGPAEGESEDEFNARRLRLTRELNRLDTLAELGPFELGGLIDLDLVVERTPNSRRPAITGSVNVHGAGVVYGRFPYPIYVGRGRLTIGEDRISIDPGPDRRGLPIATPGGGRGSIMGHVGVRREGGTTVAEPALQFDLAGDKLSELLYAAMPLTVDEDKSTDDIETLQAVPRRSVVARVLAGSGISGWLNHTGTITSGDDGRPTFDVAVELYDAQAEPTEELFETLTELGMPAPRGISFDSVQALVNLTPQHIRLVDFRGRHDRAAILAEAEVLLKADPIKTKLSMRFDDLAIERYLVDLTPRSGLERTQKLWDRYRPEGMYDAELEYEASGRKTELAELTAWPEELRVTIDGQQVWIVCDRGQVRLHNREVSVDDLLLHLRCGNRDDGVVALDGTYGLSEDNRRLHLSGSWTAGQLASPLISESMRIIGAGSHAETYLEFSPSGVFDAEFNYESGRRDRPAAYAFSIYPKTLSLEVRETPIFAELEPGAEIQFTPGRLILREIAGEHAGGRFRFDGAVQFDGPLDADLDVEYFGRLDSPQLMALLPSIVRSALEKIDLHTENPAQLTDARVQVLQVPGEHDESKWDTAFEGRLGTSAASLALGKIDLTEIDGVFDIDAAHDPELGTRLEIDVAADRALVTGRELTSVEADLSLQDDGRVVAVPRLRADAYGGVITGHGRFGLDEGSPYDGALELGLVGLSGLVAPAEVAEGGKAPEGATYASFRFSGRRGDEASRRGRGAIRVAYGRMADMPVTLRLLQLFELSLPVSGALDFADVDFYLDGDTFVFERLFLECPTLRMQGEGEMRLPDFDLDLRLRTRGTVPVVHDIIAAVSDALFLVRITGPINDPKASLVALPRKREARLSRSTVQAPPAPDAR